MNDINSIIIMLRIINAFFVARIGHVRCAACFCTCVGENPRPRYKSTTRATLACFAVLYAFPYAPVNVPRPGTTIFDAHAVIIIPAEMAGTACAL